MGKLLVAAIIVILAYFVFLKRTEPPKELLIEAQEVEGFSPHQKSIPTSATEVIPPAASATVDTAAIDSTVGSEGAIVSENESADETTSEIDPPKDNVDQTVIGNEKRLAEANSAEAVFDLLRKLRIRPKKLADISTEALVKDYARFWGTYQGPVVNNRQEVLFNYKIEMKPKSENGKPQIYGYYQIVKPGKPATMTEFYGDKYGVQLVGRDALVISSGDNSNYFQFYKLDNGYLAGNYYERKKSSYRVYRFILKNK